MLWGECWPVRALRAQRSRRPTRSALICRDLFMSPNSSTMIILYTVCTKAAMQKALVLVLTQDTKKGMVDNPGAGQGQCISTLVCTRYILYPRCSMSDPSACPQTEMWGSQRSTCLARAGTGTCGSITTGTARWRSITGVDNCHPLRNILDNISMNLKNKFWRVLWGRIYWEKTVWQNRIHVWLCNDNGAA